MLPVFFPLIPASLVWAQAPQPASQSADDAANTSSAAEGGSLRFDIAHYVADGKTPIPQASLIETVTSGGKNKGVCD